MKNPLPRSSVVRKLGRLAFLLAACFALSAPAWADNVYVQYSDGRVIYVPRTSSRTYVNNGGVVVQRLPNGYVSAPYTYSNGVPTYYTTSYWHKHNRHWQNDPDGNWHNNNNNNNNNGYNNGHNNNGNNGQHNGNYNNGQHNGNYNGNGHN